MLNNDISLYYTYMYVLTIKKPHYDVPKLKNVLERSRKRECAKIFTSWPTVEECLAMTHGNELFFCSVWPSGGEAK